MAVKIAPDVRMQFFTAQGAVLNGGKLFAYVAGSTTKQNTYTDSTGNTANANPIVLNSDGRTPNGVWLTSGAAYKFVLAPSTDSDPPVSPIWTEDNVAGINDTSVTQSDEWVASNLTPTYVSATSFTMSGDQTTEFHVGRRLKSTNTGGTVYSTITVSAYAALTTITVVNDSSTLDSGLSATYYGILRNAHHSVPSIRAKGDILSLSAAGTLSRIAAGTDGYRFLPSSAATSGLAWAGPSMDLWNGTLTASQNATVLTVAIKTVAGNDPSDNDPVFVFFRNATSKTGDVTIIKINAATSIATTVGGTFGVANSIAFRLWVVGFNDSGTFRLGLVNCLTTAAGSGAGRDVTAIFALSQFAVVSSTQIGAGSTSAGVFYTAGAAVSSKAYAILANLTYESGLATAGTFNVDQSRLDLHRAGNPLPGTVIQVVRNETGAVATGTTIVPDDDTIPQNTEGDQYMSQAITPNSAANVLNVKAQVGAFALNAGNVTESISLYQDSTANALASEQSTTDPTLGYSQPPGLSKLILASTTSATTFKLRAGSGSAGTTTFNGRTAARKFGGVMNSYMQVDEVIA